MDPWHHIAQLDAEEQALHAQLAQVRARRQILLAEMRQRQVAAPAVLLDPIALLDRWRVLAPATCPPSVKQLLRRVRAAGPRGRWRALAELGERHRAGRMLRWPAGEVEMLIKERRTT